MIMGVPTDEDLREMAEQEKDGYLQNIHDLRQKVVLFFFFLS